MIRPANTHDAEFIASIYNHYVSNTTVTFEESPVSIDIMASRIEEVLSFSLPWIVIENQEKVVGYAYATRWKGRSAYRYSVESTVYLDRSYTGKGYGKLLYHELLAILKSSGIHSIIGGIALPNPQSVVLHEKMGFQKIAHFSEIGYKFNQWLDVGYWQLKLG